MISSVAGTSQTRARVLIVDDDPLFRNLLVSLLRRDFMVSVAASGEEGFQKAIEHVPDVAVIDIQMPGWNGLKTLTEFRRNSVLATVKTIVLTGDSSRETVLAAIQAGACDYFIKSGFNREEFVRKLMRLIPQPTEMAASSETRPSPQPSVAAGHAAPVIASPLQTKAVRNLQETIDGWE